MRLVTAVVPLVGLLLILLCVVELAKPRVAPRPGQGLAVFGLCALFTAAPLLEWVPLQGSQIARALNVATVLALAPLSVLALSMGRRSVRLPVILFAPALLVLVFVVVNTLNNPFSSEGGALTRLVLLAFWVAVALLVAIARLTVKQASLLLVLQFGSACALSLLTDVPVRDCDSFKCGPLGSLFTGPFRSENLMGQVAALALVSLVVKTTKPIRWFGGGAAGLVLFATVSRTSAIAVVAALVAAAVIHRLPVEAVRVRARAGFLFVLAATGAGLLVVFTADPGDFSNRGWFWRRALNAMEGRWAFGRGVDEWIRLQQTDALPDLYPHSQYLLLIFWAGVLGLTLWLGFLKWTLGVTAREVAAAPYATALAVLVSTLGIAETFWNPLSLDARTMTLSIFLMLSLAATEPEPPEAGVGPGRRTPKVGLHSASTPQLTLAAREGSTASAVRGNSA
jgi:hypothetical protein